MPKQSNHSRPPSWSSLFPPSPTSPKPILDWQPPKYSPRIEDPDDYWRLRPAHPSRLLNRFWARYGKLLAAGLAVCTIASTLYSARLLLLGQPVVLHSEVKQLPVIHTLDDIDIPSPLPISWSVPIPVLTPEEEYDVYIRQYLNGPPTEKFESNLRPDVQYITGWIGAGWTNDVMTYANLIHLALLTQRIPIIGPFAPSHLPQEAGFVPFGEVFDVPRLSKEVGIPILEWKDVKAAGSSELDVMGCWSTWAVTQPEPLQSKVPGEFKIDVSYTAVPDNFKMFDTPGDPHVSLNKLMQLGYPSGRSAALEQHESLPAPVSKLQVEPSDHLLCYDFLYYTSIDNYFEWWYDWSPQWRLVGTHLHWAPGILEIARGYLRQHFGVDDADDVPPYIAVHARRGDFGQHCGTEGLTCLPTHEQLKRRVEAMKAELSQRGIETDLVLVTSDETAPEWWEGVLDLGYTFINHTALGTEAKYGLWYGPFLDAVFQSIGSAVVGTERSTMSLLAERRVQDWYGGPTTRLKFWEVAAENER